MQLFDYKIIVLTIYIKSDKKQMYCEMIAYNDWENILYQLNKQTSNWEKERSWIN